MITLVKKPAVERVLLDANNTDIEIQSSNGSGYYFRALIYVDDELFDTQGWSRKDAFTAVKNLAKLYNPYYENEFIPFSVNQLIEKTNLIKKISIEIEEKLTSSDTLVDAATLPEFYFMYNVNPVYFDDTTKVQTLGVLPSVLQIPVNGKMIFPFFIRADNEAVTVEVKDNFGNTLNIQNIAVFTGKKIFEYHFSLEGITLQKDTIYFETTITCGLSIKTLQYRLMRYPDFPVKELFFKNNFGYFIPAYIDGEMEIANGLKISDYQAIDGSYHVSEINEELTYTINTGNLLTDERPLVNQIITSYEVLLKVNNTYRKIQNATKKELQYRDKKHNYAQDLAFTFVPNGAVNNIYENAILPDWDERDFKDAEFLT